MGTRERKGVISEHVIALLVPFAGKLKMLLPGIQDHWDAGFYIAGKGQNVEVPANRIIY